MRRLPELPNRRFHARQCRCYCSGLPAPPWRVQKRSARRRQPESRTGKVRMPAKRSSQQPKAASRCSVTVTNLSPGVHAIHIHEAGKCAAPGFTTAGGHFNPANKQHGTQNAEGHHAGDLPNLTVGANGKGAFKSTIQNVIGYDLVSSSDSRGERHIEVSS